MLVELIFFHAVRLTIVVTFLISIIFTFRTINPTYLKFFPLYHATSVITELIVDKYFASPENTFAITLNIPYNIFTVLEFLFFSIIIFTIVRTGRKVIAISIASFSILFSLLIFKFNFLFHTSFAYTLENIFLLVVCFVYFNDIFSSFAIPNLSKEPSFWIVIGIMYYTIITTPIHLYRLSNRTEPSLDNILYITTNSTAYILMYLLFIKAYTCKVVK